MSNYLEAIFSKPDLLVCFLLIVGFNCFMGISLVVKGNKLGYLVLFLSIITFALVPRYVK